MRFNSTYWSRWLRHKIIPEKNIFRSWIVLVIMVVTPCSSDRARRFEEISSSGSKSKLSNKPEHSRGKLSWLSWLTIPFWRWRRNVQLKQRADPELFGITAQNIAFLIVTSVRTLKPILSVGDVCTSECKVVTNCSRWRCMQITQPTVIFCYLNILRSHRLRNLSLKRLDVGQGKLTLMRSKDYGLPEACGEMGESVDWVRFL
jgi:hypothetical protein